ncbi:60S ribosomal protein L36a-like [Sciurus carolinensis]|uniref:60S ribosomal protein L36a-like n=1 Tax=Sciurus carolinensis TaxID=30640 RepID=UPI001FB555A3|nr:60S ribosomal protein L36a-like [Sciurus carolinensis]
MVNPPKTCQTFCKKCGKHHKVTQHQKGKDSLYTQGKQLMTGNSGCGGTIFKKKAKTMKKVVLRLECVEPNCRSKRILSIKRGKHFELGERRRERVK